MPAPRLAAALLLLACAAHAARTGPASPPPWARRSPAPLPRELAVEVLRLVPQPPVVAWSPGGRGAKLMRLSGREPAKSLRWRADSVAFMRFFPEGARLLSTAASGENIIWDVRSGSELRVLTTPEGRLTDVQISPGGDELVAFGPTDRGLTRRLVVLSIETGEILRDCELQENIWHRVMKMLPGGGMITGVSWVRGDPAMIWGATCAGQPLRVLRRPGETIFAIELSPCGEKLAMAATAGASLWDVATGRLEREFRVALWGFTPRVAISAGGDRIAAGANGSTFIWDGRTGELSARIEFGAPFRLFAFVGSQIVTVSDSEASIWQGRSERSLGRWPRSDYVRLETAGRTIAVCGERSRQGEGNHSAQSWVVVWDAATGLELATEQEPAAQQRYCNLAISPPRTVAEDLLR